MRDLAKLETSALCFSLDASPEQLIELRSNIAVCKQFLREIERIVEEKSVAFIEQNGPFTIGEMKYVVTVDKSYKPRLKPEEMTHAFLNLHDGDMGKCVSYLAANCWKHGQLRKDLDEMNKPEMFDQFFETVIKKTVDGRPVKSVKTLNTTFVHSNVRECGNPSDE